MLCGQGTVKTQDCNATHDTVCRPTNTDSGESSGGGGAAGTATPVAAPTDGEGVSNSGEGDSDAAASTAGWEWVVVVVVLALGVLAGGVAYWRHSRDRALNNLFKGGPGSSSTRLGSVNDRGPAAENAA